MARLVLHIGTHKTGTTLVQNLFHANADRLAQSGLIYPVLGRHSGHHGLLTDWIALPPAYALPLGGRGTLSALAGRWRDTERTLLLSSEEFSRAGGRGGHVDFAELTTIFDGFDIRIVCALRTQWQFLQSVSLELARSAPPPRPADLVAQALETGWIDGLWCDYDRMFDALSCHIDPSRIHLVDYAGAVASAQGVPGQILRVIDPAFDPTTLTWPEGRRANVSPAPLPVWAAHVVAGGPAPGPATRRAAEESFALEYGADRSGCLLTRDEIRRISDHFEASNQALAQRVSRTQPGWTLTQPKLSQDTLHREDITADLWIRIARRLSFAVPETAA